jgi:hypothetical protein
VAADGSASSWSGPALRLERRPCLRSLAGRDPAPWASSLMTMRAVQITRFGGPEVMDVVDLPDPVPGEGEQLSDVSTAGVNYADTHQQLSRH